MDEKQLRRVNSKKKLGAIVVVIVLATIFVVGYLCSDSTQVGQDTRVVLVGVRGYLSEEQKTLITERFNDYAPAGAAIELRVYEFPMYGGSAQQLRDFSKDMSKGKANMFLLDDYVYDMLADETLYADLSEQFADDSSIYDRYRCTLTQKPFWVQGLNGAPRLYLLLRSGAQSSREQAAYNYDWQTVSNIISAK